MRRLLFFALLCIVCFNYSCKHIGGEKSLKAAKGNRFYGGTLHLNEETPVLNLYPYYIYDNVSYWVSCQIYDGLVKINPRDLSIVPDIAKSWEIDTSGTLYTFHITGNATFQDDPCFANGKGRKVTANDFKYSMEKLCTANPDNVAYSITFKGLVEGADEYFESSKKGKPSSGISGIRIVNDSTIQIKLVKKNPIFLNMLAGSGGFVLAQEAVEKYGKGMHLGTGPFIYSPASDSNRIILTSNPNYFRFDSLGNRLPYVDSIIISFISSRTDEFKAFQQGKLDFIVNVPSTQVDKMVEEQIADFQHKPPKYVLSRMPEMSTQYYALNISKPPFNDIRVRKAFSLAIDRSKIVSEVLQGEAFAPGLHGITPPTFMNSNNPDENYDISNIKGDSLNVDLAKKLLSEAGYPDGKKFPTITLELNSGGGVNTSVALEVQKELENNLNIHINFNIAAFGQKLEDERYMRFDMIRSRWTADYASPVDFLMLFYGANVPDSAGQPSFYNITRYKNPEFDKLIEMGLSAKTIKETYNYYQQAEQLAMNDAPIIVLWYDQDYSLTRWAVKGLCPNSMNYLDMSGVYIDERIPDNYKPDSTSRK
ncbi:MAG: ABC transporter substrate-binding protein [Bacteroidia bacterium]